MLAFDHDFFDFAIVDIADRTLDQVAVRMDQRRGNRANGVFADFVPQAGEIVKVAFDLGLGALQSGGAHDAAHRLGQRQFVDDRFQALAVRCRIDLAADPAAMAGIGHQHAITAGQAEVSGQRRALVAAFFLDHLHQQHLAALDDVLDLVTTTQRQAARAQIVGFLGLATALAAAATAATLSITELAVAGVTFVFAIGAFMAAGFAVIIAFVVFFTFVVELVVDHAAFDGRNLMLVAIVDFDHAVFEGIRTVKVALAILVFVVFLVSGAQRGLFLGMARFFGEQGFAILFGDLVIVGVDFAEGQKAVAIAAEIDKGSLQRGFDPRDFG